MKNRKRASLLAVLLLFAFLLSGCGSAKSEEGAYSYDSAAPAEAPATMMEMEEAKWDGDYGADGIAASGGAVSNTASASGSTGGMQSEKIIYSAQAEVETIYYDQGIESVYAMVERYGGFVQSANISGSNYYRSSRGLKTLRSASFTLRIPSEHFAELTTSLSELGNVPYCNTFSENVTAQYYDVQSRMEAYKTQEARLMEMLAIAETVEDMLAIQQQLTEVQYEIDSLQSRLTNYDRQVSYSTVNLTLREVEEYTETPVVVLSYWEKMGNGFRRSLRNVGDFFSDSFLYLVSHLPEIVLWAAGIAIVVVLFRRFRRRSSDGGKLSWKERRALRKAKKAAEAAEKDN